MKFSAAAAVVSTPMPAHIASVRGQAINVHISPGSPVPPPGDWEKWCWYAIFTPPAGGVSVWAETLAEVIEILRDPDEFVERCSTALHKEVLACLQEYERLQRPPQRYNALWDDASERRNGVES